MNRRAALTVAHLGVSMGVGTFLLFVLGVLAPFLVEDLALSVTQIGALPSAFFLAAALMSPHAGTITDRIGPRRSLLLLDVLVASALALLAMAGGMQIAVLAALVAGVAASLANPATNRVVADAVPVGARGLAMGIKQAGVPAGSVIAGALLPSVAETWGWRTAALTAVGLPLLDAALAGMSRQVIRTAHPPPSNVGDAGPVYRDVGLRRLRAFAFFFGGANGLLATFLVLYASSELTLSRTTAGMLAAAMGFVAVLLRVGWAHLAERLLTPQSVLVAIGLLGCAASFLVLASEWAVPAVWGAALLAGASIMAYHGVMNLLIVKLRPGADLGRASGFVLRGFFSGLLMTPIAFGATVDLAGTYVWVWAGQAVLCLAATATAAKWAAQMRRPTQASTR